MQCDMSLTTHMSLSKGRQHWESQTHPCSADVSENANAPATIMVLSSSTLRNMVEPPFVTSMPCAGRLDRAERPGPGLAGLALLALRWPASGICWCEYLETLTRVPASHSLISFHPLLGSSHPTSLRSAVRSGLCSDESSSASALAPEEITHSSRENGAAECAKCRWSIALTFVVSARNPCACRVRVLA